MRADIILRMQKVCKTFPGVTALDNVGFELQKGEVHVLLGENGAGKSTLVKILSGAHEITSGEIFLNDNKINIKSPKQSLKYGISVIYQEFNLVPQLTVAENIFLGREDTIKFGVINQKNITESSQKILNNLGVQIDASSLVKDLGVAQQQMVEVAKALSIKSSILIMDEPTSALTENEIKELFVTIKRLKSQGVSIIYISHRLEELFEICDRVTVLRDGNYVGTREIGNTSKSELIRMMVNRDLKKQYPKLNAKIGEEVLRVENLNQKDRLQKISFSLHSGEILGISGLLGSGRTELARAISGLDKFDSGKIYIKGNLEKIRSTRKAISLGIGFLTEDRKSQGLILNLSIKENISLPSLDRLSRNGIINSKKEGSAVKKYIKELRIKTPGPDQKVMCLSGGNQQKVVLAKWLCSKADIFIFDEPTRGIDVGSKVEIYNLMNQLVSEGVAILMISSELPEILGMTDRIIVMNKNRISGIFNTVDATEEKIMNYALSA
ncbi:MAG: sugar ABC transporter ATP-binding protein [Ignavibacteriaceae bacterium]